MQGMIGWLADGVRSYLLALQFFTRIPVTGRLADWVGFAPAQFRDSAAHFPGVGLLVGALAAACFALLSMLLPASPFSALVAAALSTALTVLLTGGFHEDGLADVADGLGGSLERERALDIMKDSRVGAFGAMALVLALLCKVALLAVLASADHPGGDDGYLGYAALPSLVLVCGALLAAHTVSRALPLLLVWWLPHVGDTAMSKSKPIAEHIAPGRLLLAFFWCLGALALVNVAVDAMNLAVACGTAALALLAMARLFARRLQGFTGDCLGATQQVCEIAFYLGLAVTL